MYQVVAYLFMWYNKIMDIDDFDNADEYAQRMIAEKKLLNPRVDSTFKALFTQPTPESQGALKSFLEAVTEKPIKNIQLKTSSAIIEYFGQRDVNYDILCTFDDGQQANIEMQAFKQKYDYGQRAEYHVARVLSTGMKRGFLWQKVSQAYQISVLDFVYDTSCSDIVSRYAMRTKDGRELKGVQNIVFIELPKISKKEADFEKNTALENWAIFLKDADNPSKRELINNLANKEAGLMQAKQSLSTISSDHDMWLTQFRQEIAERDYLSNLYAIEEEKKQAIAKGRLEGLEEGRLEGRLEGLEEGRVEGLEEGRKEGFAKGTNRVLSLNNLLISQNRFDDLKRASVDSEYLNTLFKEFNL